jgi:hypothetical protein
MTRIRLSQAEIDSEVVFIKSDIWEVPGKSEVVWTVSHLSGWSAQGNATDFEAAQAEIERQVEEAADLTAGGWLRVNRVHHDGPSAN